MYPNHKVVDLRKAKEIGLYPVKVRVTLNRVQKYFSLGFDLSTSDLCLETDYLFPAPEKWLCDFWMWAGCVNYIMGFSRKG